MIKVGSGSGSRQDALYMAQSYDSDDTYRPVIGSIDSSGRHSLKCQTFSCTANRFTCCCCVHNVSRNIEELYMVYDVAHLLHSGTSILSSVPSRRMLIRACCFPSYPGIDVHDVLKPWVVSAMFHALQHLVSVLHTSSSKVESEVYILPSRFPRDSLACADTEATSRRNESVISLGTTSTVLVGGLGWFIVTCRDGP